MFTPQTVQQKKAEKFFASTTDIVEAAEYGLKTYRIVKKVTNLFRKKKK